MHASLREGGVSHRAVRAPHPHTRLCGPAVGVHPAPRRGTSCPGVRSASRGPASSYRAVSTRPALPHCRLPGFLRFQDRFAWVCPFLRAQRASQVFKTSTVFFPGVFLRAVCRSGAPAGLGQSSRARMPAPGGMRRYALRPWPRSGRLLRHLCCSSSLRCEANAAGAGVRAAERSGARLKQSGRSQALTRERPEHYIALPWKEEEQRRSNRQPHRGCQGRGERTSRQDQAGILGFRGRTGLQGPRHTAR